MSIKITSYEQCPNGFYYEYPDPDIPNQNIIIDLKKGISGTFKYSRKLTQNEMNNWSNGGHLYDEDRNEIGEEGNYPIFWSNSEGMFAMEFPKDLQPGTYIYELVQSINDKDVIDSIQIVVK